MPEAFQSFAILLQMKLKFNLSRIKCLILLIEGLTATRTVNMAVLSANLTGSAKIASNYKRLQRFMREVAFDWRTTAQLLASISDLYGQEKWTLILDRTNWMLGKTHVNILYLSVAYKNVSIPFFGHFWRIKRREIPIILTELTSWNAL